jgi:hypothetical protein
MLEAALQRSSESDNVEFKASFDTAGAGDWLEIIKDIVAIANSGGGVILIGVLDCGEPTGTDLTGVLSVDPADLTNKIYKYTNIQFAAYEIVPCQKNGKEVCAIVVKASDIPIVFMRVGTYEPEPGRQKTAFGQGTVYFRHGPKSEHCTSDDLRRFVERRVEAVRASWLDGISKVVEAPAGSRFAVLPPATVEAGPAGVLPLRLTDDSSAPAYYAVPIDRTHPFRQKEVIQEVNRRLTGSRQITAHDILCIRRVHRIHKDITFCYTQNFASPRYSGAFVDWIVRQHSEDVDFFAKAKAEYDKQKQQPAG